MAQLSALVVDEVYLAQLAAEQKIKKCPACYAWTEKVDGCNYLKCPRPSCNKEWCWLCEKIKYVECNDKSHNSH